MQVGGGVSQPRVILAVGRCLHGSPAPLPQEGSWGWTAGGETLSGPGGASRPQVDRSQYTWLSSSQL